MAIIETYGELSDAQAIIVTAASEDIIDWTASDKSLGVADNLYLNITCNTSFAGYGCTGRWFVCGNLSDTGFCYRL